MRNRLASDGVPLGPKPKIFQRYGKITEVHTSGTLVSTVIEEHLLKFGHLVTFDKYIAEVSAKGDFDTSHKKKIYKISELKNLLQEVPRGLILVFQTWKRDEICTPLGAI